MTNGTNADSQQRSGLWLILGMVAVALLAAGANWWFRFQSTHRTAQFWGPEAAVIIRDAPRVELWELAPAANRSPGHIFRLGERTWTVAARREVSFAPGMTHLRNALLDDRSFEWPSQPVPADGAWNAVLQFGTAASPTALSVLISPDRRTILFVDPATGEPRALSCAPIGEGLQTVFVEWFKQAPPVR